MNDKEIGELRRRMRRDRSNMTAICGCYVNAQKEIITQFRSSLGMMPENEAEKYFAYIKRTLSGTIGKNLIDISFKTSQVGNSEEHKLLMALRESRLKDEELLQKLYGKIIENVSMEDNYLILIGCETYDVPFKSKDDSFQKDNSDESYTYIVCAICPVKQTKPNLHYVAEEKLFHDGAINHMVSAPILGFLFPAFDNRSTNIYNALYYTKNTKESNEELVAALFNTPIPKPAAEQKKSFEALLTTSLGDECSMEVVQEVHNQLCQRIAGESMVIMIMSQDNAPHIEIATLDDIVDLFGFVSWINNISVSGIDVKDDICVVGKFAKYFLYDFHNVFLSLPTTRSDCAR